MKTEERKKEIFGIWGPSLVGPSSRRHNERSQHSKPSGRTKSPDRTSKWCSQNFATSYPIVR